MIRIFKNTITLLILFFLFNANSFAEDSVKNRIRSCSPAGGVDDRPSDHPVPSDLNFDFTDDGDFNYELDNPICWAVVLPPYAAVKGAIAGMNSVCGSGSPWPRVLPSPFLDVLDITKAGVAAARNANGACAAATGGATASFGLFVATIAIQYQNAKESYNNTALCGGGFEGQWDNNWKKWSSKNITKSINEKKQAVQDTIDTWVNNCRQNAQSVDCAKIKNGLTVDDGSQDAKIYREWYYGGAEFEDQGEGACPDVNREYTSNAQGASLGILPNNVVQYQNKYYYTQRYYMRGTDPGNYACERFNPRLNKSSTTNNNNSNNTSLPAALFDGAYKCCINRSKTTACVVRELCKTGGYLFSCPAGNKILEHKFCEGGSRCSIGPLSTKTEYQATYQDNNRMICVSSYNMCPYNFNIGGGSTKCDYYKDGIYSGSNFTPITFDDVATGNCDGKSEIRNKDCSFNNKAGKCKNYCQYLNHCVVVAGNNYIYNSDLSSPYFSRACVNFIGDSKNEYGYNTGVFTGTQKHFTAPMAQCVRETLENIFTNKAGHTKCGNMDEYPDKNGNCYTNLYVYKEGQNVDGNQSFFSYLQEKITSAIKMVLTISIMMQGLKILLTGSPIKSSELIMYIIKIGLVLFFVTGNAWQSFFFDGVYNASSTFSNIVMNIKTSDLESQRDGCQFGKITISDGTSTIVSQYPAGKEYLAVFDTFDCKIARYLGFGPSFSVANIAKLILAGFFTGPIGIYFAVLTMIFGFYMVIIGARALHIFITSAFAIILLVYISPITITAVLFKKTEKIFNSWLLNITGYSLQAIILFAYMGFFLTIFETIVSGSASFSGVPPEKRMNCDKVCVDRYGSSIGLPPNRVVSDCDLTVGQKIVDPMSDSVACMMNLNNDQFGEVPVLAPLGISIPILKDFFSDNGRQKILTMTKAALIIYILTTFMDDIPAIASNLMGGNTMPQGSGAPFSGGPINLARKVVALGEAVRKRGQGAARRAGGSALKDTKEAITKNNKNKGNDVDDSKV